MTRLLVISLTLRGPPHFHVPAQDVSSMCKALKSLCAQLLPPWLKSLTHALPDFAWGLPSSLLGVHNSVYLKFHNSLSYFRSQLLSLIYNVLNSSHLNWDESEYNIPPRYLPLFVLIPHRSSHYVFGFLDTSIQERVCPREEIKVFWLMENMKLHYKLITLRCNF